MLRLPQANEIQQHVVTSLRRYWSSGHDDLKALPVVGVEPGVKAELPLRLVPIRLPEWASSCAEDGVILVPHEASRGEDWRSVDWWLATFLLLEGWHERLWEEMHGPIHSYSFRLNGWDERAWQHAWVNRIALFLRSWAAQVSGKPAEQLLGPMSAAEFLLTHDVDAVTKTLPIRIKQGAFGLVNTLRALSTGDRRLATSRFRQAMKFLFGREDWWMLDELLGIEQRRHLRARWHFYADRRPRNFERWLFDPGYDVANLPVSAFLRKLTASGAEIGLHPSFDSWRAAELIQQQKSYLEKASDRSCAGCRQHWLRFSWRETWSAQEAVGIVEDTTLMFNDRPGFRNAAAVSWHPWHAGREAAHQLAALPTIIMDSHFFDYQPMTGEARRAAMRRWIEECRAVGGQVAVLWHPHTLSGDYGWRQGFEELLSAVDGGV